MGLFLYLNTLQAYTNPLSAAQHAHPADRFEREILAILERDTMRLRRLMRHMFGGSISAKVNPSEYALYSLTQ